MLLSSLLCFNEAGARAPDTRVRGERETEGTLGFNEAGARAPDTQWIGDQANVASKELQ